VSEESTISIFTHSKETGSINLPYFAEFVQGRVIGHTNSRQPLTAVAQFQSQTSPRGICSGVGDTESDFHPITAVLPVGVTTSMLHTPSFAYHENCVSLSPTPLTWRIRRAPNNASRWQMGFNLAFKWLSDAQLRQIITN